MIHDRPPSCQVGVVKVFLNGASGRMGQRIIEVARDSRHACAVVATRSRIGEVTGATSEFDLVIDFSSDEGTLDALKVALDARKGLLVGTTGLSSGTRESLHHASAMIPLLVAPNTSLGVAVTSELVEIAARELGSGYEPRIAETHHTRKFDKPSGTALHLAASVERGGGSVIPRESIESHRVGDVVGEHTVTFASVFDEVTITHRARSRDLFAAGALRLARWLYGKPSGMYGLEDWFRSPVKGAR